MNDTTTHRRTLRRGLSLSRLLPVVVVATAAVAVAVAGEPRPVGARVEPTVAEATAAALAGPSPETPNIVPVGATATVAARRIEAPVPGCLIGPGTRDIAHSLWVDEPVIGGHEWLGHRIVADPAAARNGPIVVVADSLGRQSAFETVAALRAAGWGPVCVDAEGGRRLSLAEPGISSGLSAINRIRTSDPLWAGSNVKWVIALGTNDARRGLDEATASAALDEALAAIGPVERAVAWVTVATLRGGVWSAPEAAWNAALDASSVEVVPFAAAVAPGWLLADGVHLTSAGVASRAALIGTVSAS